jgi:hypothetical protein
MISQAGRFEAEKEALVMQPHANRLKTTGATVLSRALEVKGQEVPPGGARFILSLGIRDEDKRRMRSNARSGNERRTAASIAGFRTTLHVLAMNHPDRVEVRRLLIEAGLFP